MEHAQLLAMIDLDASLYVEYDDGSKEPLALIETARDVGQPYKNYQVTLNLAKRSNLPCFVVLYSPSNMQNPADQNISDIECFRIKRLWPNPKKEWEIITPLEWAQRLVRLRKWKADQLDNEFNLLSTSSKKKGELNAEY